MGTFGKGLRHPSVHPKADTAGAGARVGEISKFYPEVPLVPVQVPVPVRVPVPMPGPGPGLMPVDEAP